MKTHIGGKYLKEILENQSKIQNHIGLGNMGRIDVYHDGWCKIYKGKACNCNPEIKVRKCETVEEVIAPPKPHNG